MNFDDVHQVIQIMGTDMLNSTRKVNAYIAKGWKLLSVLQVSDTNHDGGYSCALFVLGHADADAIHPSMKEWEL